jgi:hypothetical protein
MDFEERFERDEERAGRYSEIDASCHMYIGYPLGLTTDQQSGVIVVVWRD